MAPIKTSVSIEYLLYDKIFNLLSLKRQQPFSALRESLVGPFIPYFKDAELLQTL
jgi:hypothetical protein